mmetsp:Transcript_43740/g.102941  ORF Transcript_43740/g.102941 Transcript_43740/m.102941 type:complete len:560 (-) Transcript_43740:108-1787(-)|eukprot:CAMPEP_0177702462 /NCGR_PEP_ID=MMETSP0484_2-20121128/7148_1 /TAXON_ID=354590 /ORGANISM="Rhodomonas lens, Strain RHODO" /LENGTH=559 /DNA_ID=CAMNT_0019213745 /DNA_START=251 /DNA_END=1930 /DNA_ORIENTATION=+
MIVVNEGREPLELELDLVDPAEQQSVWKVLALQNKSANRCAFKIRTTSRERFSTTPNSGILAPGQRVNVNLCMTPLTQQLFNDFSADPSTGKDKFMISSCEAPSEVTEATIRGDAAQQWWDARDPSELKKQVVTCRYTKPGTRVEVPQKKLCFVREPPGSTKQVGSNRVIAEEVLVLLNNTKLPHAIKIRTTARDRYRVEPSCAIINKGDKFPVKISMVHAKGYANDMFQIRCCPLEESMGVTESTVKSNSWWASSEVKPLLYDFTLQSTVVSQGGQEIADLEADLREGEDSSTARRSVMKPEKSEPATTTTHSQASNFAEDKFDALLKIVIIGDSGVGKTSLLTRFSEDTFSESFISTIGADFKMRTLTVKDRKVKLQVWDTAGQNRFKLITSAYYRGADGIIVVYDVTNQASFDAVDDWMAEIDKMKEAPDVPVMVLGNKSDLVERRRVQTNDAQRYCSEKKVPLAETSAKTAFGVENAFCSFSEKMLERRDLSGDSGQNSMSAMEPRKPAADFGRVNSSDTPPLIGAQQESEEGCAGCIAAMFRKCRGDQGYSERL